MLSIGISLDVDSCRFIELEAKAAFSLLNKKSIILAVAKDVLSKSERESSIQVLLFDKVLKLLGSSS